MILRNLLRRKLRTLFAILGVGVGVSIRAAIFNISNDLIGNLRGLLATERGDLIVLESGKDILMPAVPLTTDGRSTLAQIGEVEGVKGVTPLVWSEIRTHRSVGSNNKIIYYGVRENSPTLANLKAVEHAHPGQPLIADNDPNGFIVGKRLFDLANAELKGTGRQLKVGDKVPLESLIFDELSGYFSADGKRFADLDEQGRRDFTNARLKEASVDPLAALSMTELYIRAVFTSRYAVNEVSIFFPMQRAQQLRRMKDQASYLIVELEDSSSANKDRMVETLNARFDRLHFFRSDRILDNQGEVVVMQRLAWGLSAVAALAGALGVLNTLLISVMERTREIGLLLAVGWSRRRVLWVILVEGALISALGAVLGVILGMLAVLAVKHIFDIVILTPGFDLEVAAQAFGMALGLGLLASFYPAWRASRMQPVEALRFE